MKRKRKRGTTYAVRWIDPASGKMRCEGCGSDRQLVRRVLDRKRSEIRAGIMGDAIRVGFDEFVAMVLARMQQKERSAAAIKTTKCVLERFRLICRPRDAAGITTWMIDQYDAERRKGYRMCSARQCRWSNAAVAARCTKCDRVLRGEVRALSVATRLKELKTLKAALRRAVKEYRLRLDPFTEFQWPTVDQKLPRALELDEVLKLMAVADAQWRAYIYVGVSTGMRPGELLSLIWTDVNLERGVCKLHGTKANRDRLAYFDDHTVRLLRELRDSRRVAGAVEAPVFVRPERDMPNVRWTASYLVREWHRLRDRAGVAYCAPKDLRKTCATHLAEAGVNQRLAREVTGHATTAVLERYYQSRESHGSTRRCKKGDRTTSPRVRCRLGQQTMRCAARLLHAMRKRQMSCL